MMAALELIPRPDGYDACSAADANGLLSREHYLGPIGSGQLIVGQFLDGDLVACQAWGNPTSRRLPQDGSWLELKRWCLTPAAGANAGSRMHRAAVRVIRTQMPSVTTLVSYSDPSAGHTGSLYKACNWRWAPTWHRLFPPPSGNGSWKSGETQHVKDRWVFHVKRDSRRDAILAVKDGRAS